MAWTNRFPANNNKRFGASFPLPQTIMLRLVFHRSGPQNANGHPTSAADFWQRQELANTPSELPWRNRLKPKREIFKTKFFIKYTVIIH
jgi:hypothetical protein